MVIAKFHFLSPSQREICFINSLDQDIVGVLKEPLMVLIVNCVIWCFWLRRRSPVIFKDLYKVLF